jgi:hypothetical protein
LLLQKAQKKGSPEGLPYSYCGLGGSGFHSTKFFLLYLGLLFLK